MLNKNLIITVIVLLMIAAVNFSCNYFSEPDELTADLIIDARIAKWFNDHTAAISVTYDEASYLNPLVVEVTDYLESRNFFVDFELVTYAIFNDSVRKDYLLNNLVRRGFSYFGHGDDHINHDQLSYDDAYGSFKRCFEQMNEAGLKPVAYAYPGGFGNLVKTRKALSDAGFLSGRKFEKLDNLHNPYIVPGEQKEPEDWFGLPTLVMQAFEYKGCYICINNTQELMPYLEECLAKTAWLILTYHAIGMYDLYGYYHLDNFKSDVNAIKEKNFWRTSMNSATLYVKERAKAKLQVRQIQNEFNETEKIIINLDDDLPDDIYDQPLTIVFEIPFSWVNKNLKLMNSDKEIGFYNFSNRSIKISLKPVRENYIMELVK